MQKITDNKLDIDFYDYFMDEEDSEEIFNILEANMKANNKTFPNKRSNLTYGDPGLVYEINFKKMIKGEYKDNIVRRPTISWNELPILIEIKECLEKLTKQVYNICVIQRYPNGKIGINPHRDKEMTHGTLICGISLGQERILQMSRYEKDIDISLPSGSLYILNPPTNDYWSHSILEDKSEGIRYSLTFRNYIKYKIKLI